MSLVVALYVVYQSKVIVVHSVRGGATELLALGAMLLMQLGSLASIYWLVSYLRSGKRLLLGASLTASVVLLFAALLLLAPVSARPLLSELQPVAVVFIVVAIVSIRSFSSEFSAATLDRAAQIRKLERELLNSER